MMSVRTQRVKAYAERFHAGLRAGLHIEDVVQALAEASKRALVDATPPETAERKKLIAFYAKCAEVLDAAAAQIKEAR